MRAGAPFQHHDLDDLDDRLLARAVAVVPMRDVAAGHRWTHEIGLRHDIDNVIEPAVEMARWEADRGYRSSYYALHSAAYWRDEHLLRSSLEAIAAHGHEIGVHNNALAESLLTGVEPRQILADAVDRLRRFGFEITGTVAHGDPLCYGRDGQVRFVNDELFVECARDRYGDPGRQIGQLSLDPVPLAEFGLEYDANWLGRGAYLSDSGGRWSDPGFDRTAAGFPYDGQLHMLVHCDWWAEAFAPDKVAA